MKEKVQSNLLQRDLIENEKRNEKIQNKSVWEPGNPSISHLRKSEGNPDFLHGLRDYARGKAVVCGVRMNNVKIGKALTALGF